MPPLPKSDKPIDITQIAQALGVSKTTVSRAISGNGRISAATRQRVLDYVKKHNYTPSMMARGLVKRCSYNISLVISTQFSDFELPFLRKVMRSVYQVAGDSDYDVLLTLVGENETRPVERLLDNRKIDGLILTRTLERDPLIPLLKARKVPFVAIGQPEDDQVLSVDHDQVGGCREMTSLLLMKGISRCWAAVCCTPSTNPDWRASGRLMSRCGKKLTKACCFWSWKATICAWRLCNRL